jgi:hypothetical protein
MSTLYQHDKTTFSSIIYEGNEPAYSAEGVDLTLIRWMLSLSPTERLQHLQQNIKMILRLQGDPNSD